MSIIKTIDLTKKFGDFTANDRINISVEKQEIKCIVGENGAGKSTLMNMLYGLLRPTSGKILLHEKETVINGPMDAIAHGLGMVHQHFKLVPSLTVYENILLGAELKKSSKSPIIDRKKEIDEVKKLIEKYKFELDPTDKIEDISVGGRQRVEILKMLYRNVDILILDEPTAVLTPQEVDELFVNLKELRAQGKTIIVITHKLREVMELSDSVTVIKQGKVVGNVLTKDTSEEELAQMMVGREVVLTVQNTAENKASEEIAYQVEDVCTINDYGKEVLQNISFCVHKGEILGVAGVEGNGQSELVKVLTGLMKTTKGKVSIYGKDVTDKWPDELRQNGLGIIPEDRYAQGLCGTMSIADNCIAGYHSVPDVCKFGLLDRKNISCKRDRFVKDFDIRVGDINGNVGQLSGGNAQKIIIAREFESNPKLLIACQPTRGVDIGSIEFIHKQILDFRNKGNAVLLISSELSEVMSLSDRIIVMYKGRIIGELSPKEVSRSEIGLLMAGIQNNKAKGAFI
ncbi:ABC transporter ATP-binding protein [Caproiciproducens galactitolivorans]|uniref:Ribose import ATP-binding protein RbsA n=1 Tax=Caproiciproducens galactitolivorans TaxID=642589 RepID=A0A4Z0Y039_9FIRM|nr:ABC transporter ATP-binding protein [Caproiciproducens galactitolivorans]QEY33678.1 ABC transporter ATP-binding protein [Caproiciproducens galactitolivorans]TGJ76197.1 ribose import ATP-binding protein RbsA [Caproiciproducens galactitolivorans]